MSFDPQKSREAHSQIGRLAPLAAASKPPSHPQHSPAEDTIRAAPQSAPSRGEGADQLLPYDADYISLGAAAALVVVGLLAMLQAKGVL